MPHQVIFSTAKVSGTRTSEKQVYHDERGSSVACVPVMRGEDRSQDRGRQGAYEREHLSLFDTEVVKFSLHVSYPRLQPHLASCP